MSHFVLDKIYNRIKIVESRLSKRMVTYVKEDELKDFSIVTFKHKVNGKDLGTIGIIGPKRMDYSKVISVMKYINKKLNND